MPIDFLQLVSDPVCDAATLFVDCETASYAWGQSMSARIGRPAKSAAPVHNYVPIIFSAWDKTDQSDDLLVCFGALAIGQVTRTEIPAVGKVIYGEAHGSRTVRIGDRLPNTRRVVEAIISFCRSEEPPPLVLNKHCPTCDFHSRCRAIAVERDNLSLLGGMTAKERAKYEEKGISTITQLSYGYRPRRRKRVKPPLLRGSPLIKHDHKLKALAIKKAQTHVVGSPSLCIVGTPVFMDVEGMRDRDFYYLIGLRYESEGKPVEQSYWANGPEDESDIWQQCLRLLRGIENPQIVHYGAYESRFLKRMRERWAPTAEDVAFVDRIVDSSINLLGSIYGRIYFPTFSNSLKEIGRWLGFEWAWPHASGSASILLRRCWELTFDDGLRRELIMYNIDDCRAAAVVSEAIALICSNGESVGATKLKTVNTSSMEVGFQRTFGKFASAMPEFNKINSAAYWDYQRSKVYIRTDKEIRRSVETSQRTGKRVFVEKDVKVDDGPDFCPKCHSTMLSVRATLSYVVFDLKFMRQGIKRWAVRYHYNRYGCDECSAELTPHRRDWQYGQILRAYVMYLLIEMRLSYQKSSDHITSLFNLPVRRSTPSFIKFVMANKYEPTYRKILQEISQGSVIHADETKCVVRGGGHYIWVFTNLTSVAYVYAETREAAILEDLLKGFTGVLVSDFYAAYDSVPCAQQKCLIHLMRDINEDVLKHPFNEELASIARGFGHLLREIVETIDAYGLKARHLGKHKRPAARFIENVEALKCTSEVGSALKKRIDKNKDKLFTFLDHDGVPWNNNNAEHAVHAFVKLRNAMMTSTPKGTKEYAVLASIQQTLHYRGKSFLDFLRSGKTDIDD